jgi:hypothetical protein
MQTFVDNIIKGQRGDVFIGLVNRIEFLMLPVMNWSNTVGRSQAYEYNID